jgi:outer membrane murein-binding lipoprotein Lpp
MTSIEQAQKIVADLEDELEALNGRSKILQKQKQELSYSARTGDKGAKAKLDKISVDVVTLTNDIEITESALREAKSRCGAAEQVAARAADHEKATQLAAQIAALNAKLQEELDNADDAFSDAIGSVLSARAVLMEMHTLGVITSPTDQLFRINSVAAIKTAIQKLPQPWINDFEFMRLAPSQKKEFKSLGQGWCDQIANQTAARLGATKDERAA